MNVLFASWCVLYKWEEINFKYKWVRDEDNRYKNPYWKDIPDRMRIESYGQVFALLAGFTISKCFHGRRMQVTFFFLLVQLFLDTLIMSYRFYAYEEDNYIDIIVKD